MTDKLFEMATRKKWRFPSARGELTVEQLWDLPLLAKTTQQQFAGFDLNGVARALNASAKALGEENFVATRANPEKAEAEAKLELVKAIIATKQDEAKKAEARAAKAEEKRRIMDILAQKDDETLRSSSAEELRKRLAALEADEAA